MGLSIFLRRSVVHDVLGLTRSFFCVLSNMIMCKYGLSEPFSLWDVALKEHDVLALLWESVAKYFFLSLMYSRLTFM